MLSARSHNSVLGHSSRLLLQHLLCNMWRKCNEEVLAMWPGGRLGGERSVNSSGSSISPAVRKKMFAEL